MTVVVDHSRLLVALRPWAQRVAANLLGHGANRHDIDDLAQEGYLALVKALVDFDGDPAEVWCKVVLRNGMGKRLQYERYALRDQRRLDLVGDALDVEALSASAELAGVQEAYHDGRVAAAVDALPPSYRTYVIKRFWQGYPTTELQRTMSPSTWTRVKPRLARELRDLVSA